MPEKSSSFNPMPIVAVAVMFIIVIVIFFGDRENPVQVTKDRMARIEQAVLDYAEQNGGAPESLAALDLPEETLLDHLGEPFILTVNNGTVNITSYGSDKKPGGFFFKRDRTVTIEL